MIRSWRVTPTGASHSKIFAFNSFKAFNARRLRVGTPPFRIRCAFPTSGGNTHCRHADRRRNGAQKPLLARVGAKSQHTRFHDPQNRRTEWIERSAAGATNTASDRRVGLVACAVCSQIRSPLHAPLHAPLLHHCCRRSTGNRGAPPWATPPSGLTTLPNPRKPGIRYLYRSAPPFPKHKPVRLMETPSSFPIHRARSFDGCISRQKHVAAKTSAPHALRAASTAHPHPLRAFVGTGRA